MIVHLDRKFRHFNIVQHVNTCHNYLEFLSKHVVSNFFLLSAALHAEIQNQNQENEKLLKEIDGLRSALLPSW